MAALKHFEIVFNSPNAPGVGASDPIIFNDGLAVFRTGVIHASLQGAVGGTLELYLQMSPDGGVTRFDYARFPDVGAGFTVTHRAIPISRHTTRTQSVEVGKDSNPLLAGGQFPVVLGGDWGDRMRVIGRAGSGTTAGAEQRISIMLSE